MYDWDLKVFHIIMVSRAVDYIYKYSFSCNNHRVGDNAPMDKYGRIPLLNPSMLIYVFTMILLFDCRLIHNKVTKDNWEFKTNICFHGWLGYMWVYHKYLLG